MKPWCLGCLLAVFLLNYDATAQDLDYTRKVIKKLTSPQFFGRGYLKEGVEKSAEYLKTELQHSGASPLLSTGYFQWFEFDVNTFPDKLQLKINNKVMKPGQDFIPDPACGSLKGTYTLKQADSLNWIGTSASGSVAIAIKRKLTFSVASGTNNLKLEVLNSSFPQNAKIVKVDLKNKVKVKYINKNLCAFVPGTVNNDSMIVFTAHYDHLGGIGKNTYFPGANDNASGVSMLLNLVKQYTAYPPKYKTVFVFFAGEEAGLLGSKHFVEQHTLDWKKIKFLINLDLLGTGDEGVMVVNGAIHDKEFLQLQRINEQEHYLPEIRKRGKARNSDHYWFTEAGVPCFFIYTMGGIKAYHDVYDIERTLPLTEYKDVFKLLTDFVRTF